MADYAPLEWDNDGEREYQTGIDHGILFVYDSTTKAYGDGEAWNGLTSLSEAPSGAEESPLYADNIKYAAPRSTEEFGGTIGCYMYPDGWKKCDGRTELAPGVSIGQQARSKFGLYYRTKVGNDAVGDSYGYIHHFVYGATTNPSQVDHNTVNDSPEAAELSYEFSTTPVKVTGCNPTSHLTIKDTELDTAAKGYLEKLLAVVVGSTSANSRLPLPDEIKNWMTSGSATAA